MEKLSARLSTAFELPRAQPFQFRGPRVQGRAVQLYAMLHNTSSLANVATEIARQLIACTGSVAIQNYAGASRLAGDLEVHAGLDPTAPVALFHGVPDAMPPEIGRHPATVGAFVCESDEIPRRWALRCNRLDLVLVPSRFCRDAFQRSGVTTPVALAPHGLEPDYRPRSDVAPGDRFVFYDVVNATALHRKACEELIRCFGRAFAGRDDVLLRLRTRKAKEILGWVREHGLEDRVEIDDTADAPTAEFAATYSRAHCTVHPARAEGFGLIPFQSIACETPVIAAASTGMADYLDEGNAMLLDQRGWTRNVDVYYGTGAYPDVDEEHLVELLRAAPVAWASEKAKLRRVAPAFRELHAWPAVLAGVMGLIRALVDEPDASTRRELIRAHCLADGWVEGGGGDDGARRPR